MNGSRDIDISKLPVYPLPAGNVDPCIYLLYRDGDVVYIGQTLHSLYGRIGSHRRDKEFDSFAYIHVPENELNDVEAELICRHKPEYNRSIPESTKFVAHNKLSKQQLIALIGKNIQPVFVSSRGGAHFRISEIMGMQ